MKCQEKKNERISWNSGISYFPSAGKSISPKVSSPSFSQVIITEFWNISKSHHCEPIQQCIFDEKCWLIYHYLKAKKLILLGTENCIWNNFKSLFELRIKIVLLDCICKFTVLRLYACSTKKREEKCNSSRYRQKFSMLESKRRKDECWKEGYRVFVFIL